MLYSPSKGGFVMNQVVLVGRIAKDIDIQIMPNNKKKTSLILAVSRAYKNSEGYYDTDFIRITLWNGIASNTKEFCHTGDLIGIKGRIQSNSYEDTDGNKKYSTDIIADKVTFLSSRNILEEENDDEDTLDEEN